MESKDVKFVNEYYGTTFITESGGKFYAGIPLESPSVETHWVEIPESVYKPIFDAICKTKKEYADRLEKSIQGDYWIPLKNENLWCPVDLETIVKVKLRCGDVLHGKAVYFPWRDRRDDFLDIVSYHVV